MGLPSFGLGMGLSSQANLGGAPGPASGGEGFSNGLGGCGLGGGSAAASGTGYSGGVAGGNSTANAGCFSGVNSSDTGMRGAHSGNTLHGGCAPPPFPFLFAA
eukprot:111485-Pleurochrysis_carterae.AAC.2